MNEDASPLNAMVGYLEHTHEMPPERVLLEHSVLFHRSKVVGVFEKVSKNLLERTVHHTPDIMILDPQCRSIDLVIELDGSSHRKYPKYKRRTALRDRHYREAGLRVLVIDTSKCRGLQCGWTGMIDESLRRLPVNGRRADRK